MPRELGERRRRHTPSCVSCAELAVQVIYQIRVSAIPHQPLSVHFLLTALATPCEIGQPHVKRVPCHCQSTFDVGSSTVPTCADHPPRHPDRDRPSLSLVPGTWLRPDSRRNPRPAPWGFDIVLLEANLGLLLPFRSCQTQARNVPKPKQTSQTISRCRYASL